MFAPGVDYPQFKLPLACFGRVNDVRAFDRITSRPRAAHQDCRRPRRRVAVSLPWSTSATGILLVLLLLALIPTLDWDGLRRELVTAAGGLPVLLVALGVLGMAWATCHGQPDGAVSAHSSSCW